MNCRAARKPLISGADTNLATHNPWKEAILRKPSFGRLLEVGETDVLGDRSLVNLAEIASEFTW